MQVLIWIASVILLGASARVQAHNGAVAVAYPIEGIRIDGDFSDWPEALERYPVHLASYGDKPQGAADFRGAFRLGYDARQHALYVAVEIEDDSHVIDVVNPTWDSRDGCEVYVYAPHPLSHGLIVQYALWGRERRIYTTTSHNTHRPWQGVDLGIARQERRHDYEWRILLDALSGGKTDLAPGTVLGIDIGIYDKDEDGSSSYMTWGSGTQKIIYPARLGDVLMAAAHTPLGRLQGNLRWSGDSTGVSGRRVRIHMQDRRDSWVETTTNPRGAFSVILPTGAYRVQPTADTFGQLTSVESGRVAEMDLLISSLQGRTAPAGPGKRIAAGSGIRQGLWRAFTQMDGLLDQSIRSLTIDRKGQLWIGTTVGLSRYDGQSFTSFTSKDGLADNEVKTLIETRQGKLWIGTAGGLSRYDGQSFQNFSIAEGLIDNSVTSLVETQQGDLWVGTGRGLSRYDGQSFQNFTRADGLPHGEISALREDGAGRLWIGTWGGGISCYDGQAFKSFSTADGLSHNEVLATSRRRPVCWAATATRSTGL